MIAQASLLLASELWRFLRFAWRAATCTHRQLTTLSVQYVPGCVVLASRCDRCDKQILVRRQTSMTPFQPHDRKRASSAWSSSMPPLSQPANRSRA